MEIRPIRSSARSSGVEKSVLGKRWISRLDQAGQNRALAMSQMHGLPELIARVLAGRGVAVDEAVEFLDPTLRSLMPDPYTLTDCEKAAKRLVRGHPRRGRRSRSSVTTTSTAPPPRRCSTAS